MSDQLASSFSHSGKDELLVDDDLPTVSAEGEKDVAEPAAVENAASTMSQEMKAAVSARHTKHKNEHPQDGKWVKHKKHFFILSSAGKPIFTRYGDEEECVQFMAVLQAIVSFTKNDGDTIRSIVAGDFSFVFLLRGPIYLVTISKSKEPISHLTIQLNYIYNQLVSILTSGITKVFNSNPGYDLRSLLGGTDPIFMDLIHSMSTMPMYFMSAISCLRVPAEWREKIGSILHSMRTDTNLLFAVLADGYRLVSLVRPRKHFLNPNDLLLLLNLVNSNASFRAHESWTPLCLPQFSDKGFLYMYVSYLGNTDLCLMLITTKNDHFHELSECQAKITKSLGDTGAMNILKRSAENNVYSIESMNIPDVLHFVYKARGIHQFTMCAFEPPYDTKAEQKRLFNHYKLVHDRIHRHVEKPYKAVLHSSDAEAVYGYMNGDVEMYIVLSPLLNKTAILNACNRVMRWIKQEEDSLFILSSHVW